MVVITGITKGIGRAIAEVFATKGYDLAGCARNQTDLQVFQQEITSNYGVRCAVCSADLSQPQGLDDFVEFLQAQTQPIHCLINNAALFEFGSLTETDELLFTTMLHTNLFAPFKLIQTVLPLMKEQHKGHIFNICSTIVKQPKAAFGGYGVSKFGLYGLTKLLREELKPTPIKVTAVLPGSTFSASWEGSEVNIERLVDAKDIAYAVLVAYEQSARSVTEEICIRPQAGDLG